MIRAWLRRLIRDHAPPVAESFTSYRGSELAELAGALRRHPGEVAFLRMRADVEGELERRADEDAAIAQWKARRA
jgi:hypothetical protein